MSLAMIPGNENHFCAALTPAWNNFLLLRKSLLGIPHGRSRWMWGSAQTFIKKEEEKEITIKLNRVLTTTASQVG